MTACRVPHAASAQNWSAYTQARVEDAVRESKKVRDVTNRERDFAQWCSALSVACVFLSKGTRHAFPRLLTPRSSAEVGVWRGDFSSNLLRSWPGGGPHLLIDPFENVCRKGPARTPFACLRAAPICYLTHVHVWASFPVRRGVQGAGHGAVALPEDAGHDGRGPRQHVEKV